MGLVEPCQSLLKQKQQPIRQRQEYNVSTVVTEDQHIGLDAAENAVAHFPPVQAATYYTALICFCVASKSFAADANYYDYIIE